MIVTPTVGILVFKDDKVLLVKHGEAASHLTGAYGIPAGRLEPDESPIAAAVREFHEETGLSCTPDDLIQLSLQMPPADLPRKDGTTKRFSITLFYCKNYTGELAANHETTPEWASLSDMDNLVMITNTKTMIEGGLQEVQSMKSKVSIIVAVDEKGGIGKDNDLLFRIPADHERVRTVTREHPLVMGRKTFASLGRLLPKRTHIVITRDASSLEDLSYQPDVVVSSLEEGIAAAKKAPGSEEIFIFGGGQIFKEAIEKNLVDRLYLTIVKGDYHADTFFSEYSPFIKQIKREDHESDGYQYSFLTLEK